jgi:nucleoside-diphosphate-sugar epimerase
MKNILIIGGSYFAGRILVEELLNTKDYNIFVYNRGNMPLNMPGVTEFIGDRADGKRIKEVIPNKQWDILVDFCAYIPDHIEVMLDNLPGTLKHYIFISTTTIYDNTLDFPISEDAPKLLAPQKELGQYADYGYNKWLSECKLNELCKKKNIPYTSFRPAIIYGEYNYAPREIYFFDLIKENKTVVLPDNDLALFSFTYVTDVVKVIIKSFCNIDLFGRAFNISAPELISYRRMIQVFEEISGKKVNIEKMSVDEINKKGVPLPFPLDSHLIYSGEMIKSELDFEYTSFLAGMKNTYEYYLLVQNSKKIS